MIDDADELPPLTDDFAQFLGAGTRDSQPPRLLEACLNSWNDHEGLWTNVRNLQHWIECARG